MHAFCKYWFWFEIRAGVIMKSVFLFVIFASFPLLLLVAGDEEVDAKRLRRLSSRGPPVEDKVFFFKKYHQDDLGRDGVEPGPEFRLPTSLIPQHYFLRIRPIIDRDHPGIGYKNTAPGFVRLSATCVSPTNRIVMHKKFLTINESSIEVRSQDNASLAVTSVEYDDPRNFLIIHLDRNLTSNEDYNISMEFTANVPPNDTLRGLYSEEYFDELTNETRVMAATQMEPLRARQVLPCFDEPTYKATFEVIIGRTENFSALCNGPLVSTRPDEEHLGWYWDSFAETVKMPTYLLAIGVSNYSYNEAERSLYRLPVRVYGPTHLTNKGRAQMTANMSARLMRYFETKYGIPYHMPKVDSISVPKKRGAMENYGLITYGQYLLMEYPNETLNSELRGIFNILAHELGHQWFGNLVTCKWWSDIWLNEGFATYVSYEAMDRLGLNYDALNYMVHDAVNSALRYDAGPTSHPIHQEAFTAEQISQNMDTIGYDKGASVIRMMISFMGEETFYDGIKFYLRRLYDHVAEQDDLFQDLGEAANRSGLELPKSMNEIMYSWTLQKGFPLIRVKLNGPDSFTFTQEPWSNADPVENSTNPGTTWNVPIKFLVQMGLDSSQEDSLWLLQNSSESQNITIPNWSEGWILANPDAGGYYRTFYDGDLLTRIRTQLERNHTVFEPAARIRLLDDQFELANQKYTSIKTAMEFTRYLKNETSYAVWSAVLDNLSKPRNFYRNRAIIDDEDFRALKNYLEPIIHSAIARISESCSGSGSCEIILSQLTEWSCTLNSDWCASVTDTLYKTWKDSPNRNPIRNEIQSTIYCKIVELFGVEGFEWISSRYDSLTTRDEDKHQRSRLSGALGCTHNSSLVDSVISMILDTNSSRRISKVDSIPVFQRLFSYSQEGPSRLSLNLIQTPDAIPEYYDGDLNSVNQILSMATAYFATPVHYVMIESIAEANPSFYKDSLNSTLTSIAQNLDWLSQNREDLTSWLKQNA